MKKKTALKNYSLIKNDSNKQSKLGAIFSHTKSHGLRLIIKDSMPCDPVVINIYTQKLLKRNPCFLIFVFLGIPNPASFTLSSRNTNTQETENNFSEFEPKSGFNEP